MLSKISKKYLYGLIVIVLVIVSSFTACTNNNPEKPVDNNTPAGSVADSSESPEPSKDTPKNNDQPLDSWIGDYIFTEYIDSEDESNFYEILISKENNDYIAKITMDDVGAGVYSYIKAKIEGDTDHIDFIFSDYLRDSINTSKTYDLGDNLLGFTKTDTGITTHWDKIVPANDSNRVDGTYFKIRKNSEGYIGHWYTEIPYTGGNSTTIEISEMSNTSVSFHLYFSRTYIYDGINIKLENNSAKFVDNDGEYETSGTIEFVNNSIIVNIEKTTLPIFETGKTAFNYKVSGFKADHIIPDNGATDVDLEKGIEIEFDRRISATVNPAASIRKVDAPSGSDDEFVQMKVEIKDNKLIFLPDYDAMKAFNEVIEAGQKYVLTIDEGQYRDDVGNINDALVLEFTTKK